MTQRASSERHEAKALLHRALSDPSRLRILEALESAEGPLDAGELAERVGLHVNTVRTHLGLLAEAGLVSSKRERGSQRGRPRIVFEPGESTGLSQEAHGYLLLAKIFAGALAKALDDPARELEQAGYAWGRYLVESPAPLRNVSPVEALEELLRLNGELGFEPEFAESDERQQLLLRRCPFVELTDDYRDVLCPVHLGIMRGALAELGGGVEVARLDPFVEPGICTAELAPAGTSA